mmetsp:Transcript_114833/g.278751  ORF Transcript_114833/g.278751 Transcript_114833/m.278751 type:complete len:254 (+) Transcript_114833:448-1209(+)
MALAEHQLGRQVLGCAAQRVGAVLDVLGETEVYNLDVACLVDEQVLGLEVAIQDLARVQVVERVEHTRGVEASVADLDGATGALQAVEQLAALNQFEQHVQAMLVLVGLEHLQDERVADRLQDALLVHDVRLLAQRHNLALLQHLQRICLLIGLVAHQLHPPKRACSQGGALLQLLERDVRRVGRRLSPRPTCAASSARCATGTTSRLCLRRRALLVAAQLLHRAEQRGESGLVEAEAVNGVLRGVHGGRGSL